MIARGEFKTFEPQFLPDSTGIGPDLRKAILDARKASTELSDRLFVLENLLGAAEEEGVN